jgi:hypothetical protein
LSAFAEPAAVAQAEFFLEDQVDEVEVADVVGLGAGGQLGGRVGQVRQAAPQRVIADAGADEFTHDVAPRCRRGGRGGEAILVS